ncbi:hypothetical protein G6F49_013282 [Rhizopus delemar]|uniref:Uncharacterized protein n=2 Tax=Rhizopus TaxID=4842 RepID=A0A9P7CMF7_9FUNG|nr:hypothetical protein G6F54_008085 [Rhizopus delemar]KAG1534896.1 hypothetical protein G6F49_013282 [Rhizopus delemar]KAG1539833.1 hypothetical protein G6F51_008901 [Rhizopus arrhizus]KAG1567092.1 hypothetical protein G6F50_008530 [Rhizopus delemar]KAG1575012.1 hypothetical protein G6F48_013245 [Rhizopus delemar]
MVFWKRLRRPGLLVMRQLPIKRSNRWIVPSAVAEAGLTLSHRNLPKFQLALSVVRPFPNEEVFESVEHFLARFENIIKGSAYRDVEQVWKQFLPLCLPYSDNAWVETDLRKCNTWAEARAAFKEHHDSSLATRHYTDLVFTMQIVINEDKKK